jgi:hypothetical protein
MKELYGIPLPVSCRSSLINDKAIAFNPDFAKVLNNIGISYEMPGIGINTYPSNSVSVEKDNLGDHSF